MDEIKSSSIRSVIMDLLKTQFGGYTLWKRIETDLALLVADIPDATSEDRKNEVVTCLKRIKDFLLEKDVSLDSISFLDEEIERYNMTKQISLYEEQEDLISEEIVDRYAKMGYSSEGIVGIHLALNYEQLKKLTNRVYLKTGLIKFYVSREKMIYGKVVAESYDFAQKIPIATLLESKKLSDDGSPEQKRVTIFGDKVDKSRWNKIKEIEAQFYVYRFVSEFQQDFVLLSVDPLDLGDYVITGSVTYCDDFKVLTDSQRLPTKLPFLFAQSARSRIIKFSNHEEFNARLNFLSFNRDSLFNFPFSLNIRGDCVVLNQPDWFKWLIWSWLAHQPVGLFNPYPLHLLILGPAQSGKSLMLNAIHEKARESRQVFSGVSSTLKGLVPSFKDRPPKPGYLAESNRYAFCDEFLRCLLNTHSSQEKNFREEGVGVMNDLLEHQKREASSGIAKITVNMTARVLATSNPVKGVHSMTDLVNKFDGPFLSRWLILFQTDEQISLVRNSQDNQLCKSSFVLDDNEWVSILDYLHTFSSKYDLDRVLAIKSDCDDVLSHELIEHYSARHKHHIQCLIDGLVKARCLINKDMSFVAVDEDYVRLELIWKNIVNSWIDVKQLKSLPVSKRLGYLPENAQWLFNEIVSEKVPVSRQLSEELALRGMSKREYLPAILILLEHELLIDYNGFLRPYYMEFKK